MILLLVSFSVSAVEINFVGPCSKTPLVTTHLDGHENVGRLTIEALKKLNISYQGSEAGIASMFGTPVGDESVEILSDYEMRAYGWCYSVDGIAPEVYPHEVPVTKKTKVITWHFGYARYYKGEWVTQCSPAYSVKPEFLCGRKPAP